MPVADPPPPTYPPVEIPQSRVLLRLPNWVGDVVMAAPAVEAIRRALPDAELVAQARPALLPLAARLPGVTETFPAGPDRGPKTLLASRRQLKERSFDAAVIFPRGTRSLLAPWLAGIPVRVGFASRAQGWLLTYGVESWRPWRRLHRSRYFGLLARPFGATVEEQDEAWHLDPGDEARTSARSILRGLGRRPERPLVVFEAGSSYGPAKCWSPERFGDLAKALLDAAVDVCTVGTSDARAVEAAVGARAGEGMLRAVGRTPDLAVLAALLEKADLVVANDTGPMHVAAAVGVPVLALFGATDPAVSSPLGQGRRRLVYEPEPCSPCFLRTCPVAGHPCMEKLSVAVVHREARGMLEAATR